MRCFMLALLVLFVAACGAAPAAPVTARTVADAFSAANLGISAIQDVPNDPAGAVPNSYTSRVEFTIAEVAPRGGQVFVCDTKRNCDAIYAYYEALAGLAGPYLYQSPSGLVVAQLNSGLSPATGAAFQDVVNSFR
jgi:hypothetical protein